MNEMTVVPLMDYLRAFNRALATALLGDDTAQMMTAMLRSEATVNGDFVTLPVTLWRWTTHQSS